MPALMPHHNLSIEHPPSQSKNLCHQCQLRIGKACIVPLGILLNSLGNLCQKCSPGSQCKVKFKLEGVAIL